MNFCYFPFPVGWNPRRLFQGTSRFLDGESKSMGHWLGCSEPCLVLPGFLGHRLTPTGVNHITEGNKLPGSGFTRAVVGVRALCWHLSSVPVVPPDAISVC